MILVVADRTDISSNIICDYLDSFGEVVIRIDNTVYLEFHSVNITDNKSEFVFYLNKKLYRTSDFTSCFFRRGVLKFKTKIPESKSSNVNYFLNYHFNNDINDLVELLYFSLKENTHCIGDPLITRVNKLRVLHIAQQVGLKIPETKVLTTINKLNSERDWVVKGISESLDIQPSQKENGYTCYVVDYHLKSNSTAMFWPTVFQKKIEKAFEVRVFFIENKMYSTAIFSQENKTTITDFRIETNEPLTMCPFDLPDVIHAKLSNLNKLLEVNIGSIDLIIDKYGEFYFLEINPMGQFGAYGDAINVNLERIIALNLKHGG